MLNEEQSILKGGERWCILQPAYIENVTGTAESRNQQQTEERVPRCQTHTAERSPAQWVTTPKGWLWGDLIQNVIEDPF